MGVVTEGTKASGARRRIFLGTTFDLCQTNAYLGTQIRGLFSGGDYEFVSSAEEADTIIVTTCAFDQERESQALDAIHDLSRRFGGRKEIVVTGCLPKITKAVAAIPGVRTVDALAPDAFAGMFGLDRRLGDVEANVLDASLTREEFREGFHVQICTGCLNRCSYCAIKIAKGDVHSKPIPAILAEIQRGHEAGHRRFILLGDDCGSFGVDIGADLADLVTAIGGLGLDGLQLSLHYIYPKWFINLFRKLDPSLFRLFYLMTVSLQTVDPRVLKRMNRAYDVDTVLEMVREVRRIYPSCTLRTHIMYGFPGADRETLQRCLPLRDTFDRVQYFFFTDREIVPSYRLDGKVPRTEMLYQAWLIYQEMVREQKTGRRVTDLGNDINSTVRSIVKNNRLERVDVLIVRPAGRQFRERVLPLAMLAVAERLLQKGVLVRVIDDRFVDDTRAAIRAVMAENDLACVAIWSDEPGQADRAREIRDWIREDCDIPIIHGLPSLDWLGAGGRLRRTRSDGASRKHAATFPALVERLRADPQGLRGHVYHAGDFTGQADPSILVQLDRFNRLPFFLLIDSIEARGLSFSPPLPTPDPVLGSRFCVLRPGRPNRIGSVRRPAYWVTE